MKVVRIPAMSELLDRRSPWAIVLRSGGTGLWLLRGVATDREDVETRIAAGSACRTTADALDEWGRALECGPEPVGSWDELASCLRARGGPMLILVGDADRLLEDEPARLPTLLQVLRAAADESTVRVVFQSRFDHREERLAIFHEFGVVESR